MYLGSLKKIFIFANKLKENNMAMNLNEIDDFEEGVEKELLDPTIDNNIPPIDPDLEGGDNIDDDVTYPIQNGGEEKGDDIVIALLKSKNINPDAVKFQNDDGNIEEKPFNELSKEEQLQILGLDDSEDNYGLEDDEIDLINQLRENNLSVKDYNDYIARQAIQYYIDTTANNDQMYTVNDFSDEELYLMDLGSRLGLSEEEALEELETAKSNPDLFQKKVQSIREEYKQREDQLIEQRKQEEEEENSRQAQEFENAIIEAIQNNGEIDLGESKLSLSDDDKDEIASFILDSDSTGIRFISKALNDPETLVKMVWYALKGKEAFSEITNYYKKQISEVAKNNYNKGYGDGKTGKTANLAKSVVKKPATKKGNKPLTINDID